tara:strand:+ start:1310 stop:3001 length:1692 start_codon:yes stop_codon:yes gene_type:complete
MPDYMLPSTRTGALGMQAQVPQHSNIFSNTKRMTMEDAISSKPFSQYELYDDGSPTQEALAERQSLVGQPKNTNLSLLEGLSSAYESWQAPDPTTMQGALDYAAMPAQAVVGMAKAVPDILTNAMDNPNDKGAMFDLASSLFGGSLFGTAPSGALRMGGRSAKNPDRAADIINSKFSNATEMRDLERRMYDLTNADDFINSAKESGNKVTTPFTVGGPKMAVDEIEAMEAARKFSPVSKGYHTEKIFSPEDFEIGSYLIPNPGDPTVGGRLLESVSGKSKLTNTSGTDFMRQVSDKTGTSPAVWASGDTVMNTLQKKALLAKDNPAYLISAEQGPKSAPFNAVIAKRYEELLDTSKITSKGADEAEKMLNHRQVNRKTGEVAAAAPWQKNIPRADSPKFSTWLHSLPGTSKSEVVLRLNRGGVIDEGMPDVRDIIHSFIGSDSAWAVDKATAMSDIAANKSVRGLIGDPLVGKSIARATPGFPLRPSTNPSFPIEGTGEYVGGFGFRPRRSEVFRDWYADNNLVNRPDNAAHRGFSLSYPTQVVDAEWQDTLMKLRDAAIRQK